MLNALQDLPLLRDTYQEGKNDGLEEGTQKGIEKERRANLIQMYECRMGPMPEPVRTALMNIRDLDTLNALFPLFLQGTAADIAAKLMPRSA